MLRVLFVSDTHLGFDWPLKPRIERRRRGPDFLANLDRALTAAVEEGVDLVVHGGDLFNRSKPPARVVDVAAERLRKVADAGIPVVLVCGNHERSTLPPSLLWRHERLHLVDRPRRLTLPLAGLRVHVAGFPFVRDIGPAWSGLMRALPPDPHAQVNLLVFHQAVEGATVGPRDFNFRAGEDVIPRSALPRGWDAFLSGHIHRRQVLRTPGRAPVLYPGSVERTSEAERNEPKGYLRLDFAPGLRPGPRRVRFVPLPTRPLCSVEVPGLDVGSLGRFLGEQLSALPPDAVVRLRPQVALPGLAELARAQAPASMTLEVSRPLPS